jgi:hypothetical protein
VQLPGDPPRALVSTQWVAREPVGKRKAEQGHLPNR